MDRPMRKFMDIITSLQEYLRPKEANFTERKHKLEKGEERE